ncbi:hypothetical protein L7F22_022351 [Adiantum nelumboides]|nr:hypothetical protein [Adiantum nelumboides]
MKKRVKELNLLAQRGRGQQRRPIPEKELGMLGIPLPGGYMQRHEIPPLPRKKSGQFTVKTKVDERVTEGSTSNHKRLHEDGRAETSRSYGEGIDSRRLDERYECRDLFDDSSRRQHHREHHGRRDYGEGDSGRSSHNHDRHGTKETYRKGDRRHHYPAREEDSHGSRRYRRSRHSGGDRTLSDECSSETDKGRKAKKVHRGPDHERYDSRDPSVDDRWEP